MKILGVIAEYNPFHNGHQYHLKQSRALTGADGVICVLSSNFLQRGEPALIDKWERTRMALAGGADLVIELPVAYALRSAEFFAFGGVSLLDATGVVKYISFGSEAGNLEKLQPLADILAEEPAGLNQLIRLHLEAGLSYPSARTKALTDYIQQEHAGISLASSEVESLTANPNNILGLEYLKAIRRLGSQITPITIPRVVAGYHDTVIKQNIASATAIREALKRNRHSGPELIDEQILSAIPESTRLILQQVLASGTGPVFPEDFASPILTLIRRASIADLSALFDVRGGLENRIKEAADSASSLQDLIERIKTKRYTWTRIQRTVFHLLINLNSVECEYFDQLGGPQYIRVLGFNLRGQHILAQMKEIARLPIITRVASYYHKSDTPEPVNRMLDLEIRSTNLYTLAAPNPTYRQGNRDLLEQVIIWR